MYGWAGDPVSDAIDTARDRVGLAGLLGLGLLVGVAFLVFGSGRTKRTRIWKRE